MSVTAYDVYKRCMAMCDRVDDEGKDISDVGTKIMKNKALYLIDTAHRQILNTGKYAACEKCMVDENFVIDYAGNGDSIIKITDCADGGDLSYNVLNNNEIIIISSMAESVYVLHYPLCTYLTSFDDVLAINDDDAFSCMCYYVCAMLINEFDANTANVYLEMYNKAIDNMNNINRSGKTNIAEIEDLYDVAGCLSEEI